MFWTPKWKKEAKLTIKGSKKFINYKKDLIDEEKIKNIRARQDDVKESIKTKDKKEVKKKCNLLEQECKSSLERYKRPSGLAENTEVFFVAIVIALGIRAYYLQPFRIPTGSMQPTLNGINGHVLPEDEWPNMATRIAQMGTNGRHYYKLVADSDDSIVGLSDYQKFRFFSACQIKFKSGKTIELYTSSSSFLSMIKNQKLVNEIQERKKPFHIPVKKGEAYLEGFVESGDLVLVDKMSYHFRKPTRGETFVFDTRKINEIHSFNEKDQDAGSHYIKRCVAIPGDEVRLDDDGNIYINGKLAKDPGLQYAMNLSYKRAPGFTGYTYGSSDRPYANIIDSSEKTIICKGAEHRQRAEYAALGDNTVNSLDSRYWGKVKQYNLVGPALISLWPFTHEIEPHWGLIK